MSEENNKYVDLVSSTRGNIVENIHQGVAVAMDSEGRVIKKWGDINILIIFFTHNLNLKKRLNY